MRGTYTQTSVENLKELMSELGYSTPGPPRGPAVMEISEAGGVWTIRSEDGGVWTIRSPATEHRFRIGEEFDWTTHNGQEVKVVINLEDGNRLVGVQTPKKEGGKSIRVVREFNGDELVQTMSIVGNDDLVCVIKFKKN